MGSDVPAGVLVEVEEALGPGIDFDRDPHDGRIGRRARGGRLWLGFDRAMLVDSDDGAGRAVPVLAAVPASTFQGARLVVELVGGWESARGVVLVGRVPGWAPPVLDLARIAGRIDEHATWIDATAAANIALQARHHYRDRESHARILGGRAWYALDTLAPELTRFATPHSAAEYSLARLPRRFVRGLDGLLDNDERVLYWIERPMVTDLGLVERLRGRLDRRAALLALTDRELLWIVDHAQPDRHLSDWGVDVEIIPVERIHHASCAAHDGLVELTVRTAGGSTVYGLPSELEAEVRVMRDLIARFTPFAAGGLPRRRYSIDPLPFDMEAAARFGQEREAQALLDSATRTGEVVIFAFSPSRVGQRSPAALVLRPGAVELLSRRPRRAISLAEVASLGVTLSPLVGRIATRPGVGLSFPAPLMDRGAAFVRLTRRALADVE
jgi:hypothetical protein